MTIGTVCYSHSRGLGHLAKSFIDAGVINDICVVKHPDIPMKEWYPNAPVTDIRRAHVDTEWLREHDAMVFFETPFNWNLIDQCRNMGIRTYLVTMYECSPERFLQVPDRLLCPSALDLVEFVKEYPGKARLVDIPVEYPWKLRSTALHFIHNGGYLGMRGREGTELLIESMKLVRSPIRLTIRVQENVSKMHQVLCARDKRIEYLPQSVPYEELYATGDVSILPQKFNGMSMPLLESRASGMVVMTTDRFPANTWLPKEPLIPIRGEMDVRLSPRFRAIKEAVISPVDIAATIDGIYGCDITKLSLNGQEWGKANNWEALKPKWLEVLTC